MKKTLIVTILVVTALAIGATAVFAQGSQVASQVTRWMGMGGGRSPHGLIQRDDPLHTYMVAALASSLKLTTTDLESQLTAGKSLYDIAVAQGIVADKIPALIADARTAAVAAAVKAGAITQAQADWMQSRGMGFGMSRGMDMFDGENGLLHAYMVGAVASTLELTTAEVEARFAAGESAYDIVVAKGTATDQVQTVLTTIHTTAIDAALKAGVITQAQADAMKSNTGGKGFDHMEGGMFGNGRQGHGVMGGGRGNRGGQNVQP